MFFKAMSLGQSADKARASLAQTLTELKAANAEIDKRASMILNMVADLNGQKESLNKQYQENNQMIRTIETMLKVGS